MKVPDVGSFVEVWLFNSVDQAYYPNGYGHWIGEVRAINRGSRRPYTVTRPGFPDICVSGKEIWRIVESQENSLTSGEN